MAKPDIRPDQLFKVQFDTGESVLELEVSAAFDSIHHYAPLGMFLLKVLDTYEGLLQSVITEETALKLAKTAFIPIVPRDFLYQNEYECYLEAQGEELEEWLD